MDDKTKLKNSVLSNLRAVLLSVKGTCPLWKVAGDYQMLLGEEIPFKTLGYKTLLEFVTKENAFKIIKNSHGEVMVDAMPDSKSAHIVEMIQKQKSNKSRSKGRSRRFAPVRSNVTPNNRLPSSQNNWQPQKLTPVKSKKPATAQRRRSSRPAPSSNSAAERLKTIQNIPFDNPTTDAKESKTICYKNSKPTSKDNNGESGHHPVHQPMKRQQSYIKNQQVVGGGDLTTEEVIYKKSTVSRENSNDSNSTAFKNLKAALLRQSSQNNESVVELLKNVPKELLRDVPFDNNDIITFNDILDRTLSINTTSMNQIKSPSSSILLSNNNISNATTTIPPTTTVIQQSTTHDSASEVLTDPDYSSSNPTSPTLNNINWSTMKSNSVGVVSGLPKLTTTVTAPRGRGRLLRSLTSLSATSDVSLPTPPVTEHMFNFNDMNIQQFSDNITDSSTVLPTVYHAPTTKLPSEQLLCDLMNELQLTCKIDYKVIKRPSAGGAKSGAGGGGALYNAQLKVGHVQCSTWPDEFLKSDDALDAVFKKALNDVNKAYSYIRLPISPIDVIGDRLRPLIAEHPTGIWNDTVETIYTEKYNERLPTNWLCLAIKYGIRTDCAPNEKFILTLVDEENTSFGDLNTSTNTMDDLNSSISAPILPISDDNYHNVIITCTNSTVDVSFRIIGTQLSERYRRLTVDMEMYYNNEGIKPINPYKINVGNYYAVSNNNTWMRVRVLEHPQMTSKSSTSSDQSTSTSTAADDAVEVLCSFIDHGHEYPIQLNQLHELPYTFRSIPAQAIHCSLMGLEELSESELASQYLEDLVGKHLFLKVFEDVEYGGYNVVLFDTTTDDDINVNLNIMNKVCNDLTKSLNVTTKSLNEIKEMTVVYADNDGCVYLHDQQSTPPPTTSSDYLFNDLMDKLMLRVSESIKVNDVEYVTSATKITLHDHLYLAKYIDGSFYRCKFIELNIIKNIAIASFIDYGNVLLINLNTDKENILDLSTYSHALQNIPPQCIKARLQYNVPALPENVGDTLLKIINEINDLNQSILVKVLVPSGDKPNDLPVVELFARKCNASDSDTLYSINKFLGLFMRQPKIGEDAANINNNNNNNLISNNNNSNSSQKNGNIKPKKKDALYDITKFPSNSTFPSTGDLPQPILAMDGTYFDVNIPSAVNPWNFFIQPYKDGKELKQWMLNLQEYYNRGPGSKRCQLTLNDIKAGECYVALHYADNTWYRACVNQTIDHDSISAFFVDYGQYVVLNSKQLQPLHSKFKKLPFQVLKARLFGVSPCGNKWSVEDCRTFQELVVGKQFVCTIKEIGRDILHDSDNVLSVILIDTTTNVDVQIHKLLIQKGVAVPVATYSMTTSSTTSSTS